MLFYVFVPSFCLIETNQTATRNHKINRLQCCALDNYQTYHFSFLLFIVDQFLFTQRKIHWWEAKEKKIERTPKVNVTKEKEITKGNSAFVLLVLYMCHLFFYIVDCKQLYLCDCEKVSVTQFVYFWWKTKKKFTFYLLCHTNEWYTSVCSMERISAGWKSFSMVKLFYVMYAHCTLE